MRDDRTVLFATYLPAGVYTYSYLARATTPGAYSVLPAQACLSYSRRVRAQRQRAVHRDGAVGRLNHEGTKGLNARNEKDETAKGAGREGQPLSLCCNSCTGRGVP